MSIPARITIVVGTRPEAIKLAPLVLVLRARRGVTVELVATGQHRELASGALTDFGLTPDRDLDIMRVGQTPAEVVSGVLRLLEPHLAATRPDWAVAVGDTATVVAAALAAGFAGVPFAHVEAGLRTGDKRDPFPEELDRRIATAAADLHLAPTRVARSNLIAEGVARDTIHVTGNPGIDALLRFLPEESSERDPNAPRVLVTLHRRGDARERMHEVCRAIGQLAEIHTHARFVWPVHPAVRAELDGALPRSPRIAIGPPLDYRAMIAELVRSDLVLTDSGGVQEEAATLGIPTLVLRHATERVEALWSGAAQLVGTSRETILAAAGELLVDPALRAARARPAQLFGDGNASERIASALLGESFAPFDG